jgi:hypothetical protein
MNLPWFKQKGLLFIPVSPVGWLILLAAIFYTVYVFIDIDSRSHSVSDTLMNFVFQLVLILASYSLVGMLTSRKSGNRKK